MTEQTSRLAIIIDSTGAQRNAEGLAGALAKMTQAGQKAADSAGRTAKATDQEAKSLSDLLDKIDPVNAALNRLDDQQRQLAKFQAKGFIDSDTFSEYSKKIEETRNRLTGFSETVGKAGVSSRQAAYQMRMIPAQMTDIAVSLAGGQSPFMVLLQQGGQLKDMFGGIGPAIKGVGTYISGLVNPATVAAASIGALVLAYHQGVEEQEEFTKTLILNGNTLSLTAGQLGQLSQQVARVTNSSVGNAASVLNQVVASGKISRDTLQEVTATIINMSRVTGQATDSMLSDFEKIARDPAEAIAKLNEQYHFLTLETYNRIKQLQDEGNATDAARLATIAYTGELNRRTIEIRNNLSDLEKSWDGIWSSATKAWDAMRDSGRGQSPESQLATLEESLADARRRQSEGGIWNRFTANANGYNIGEMEQQIDALKSQITTQSILNDAISEYQKRQDEGIKSQKEANALEARYQTRQQQRAKELATLNKLKAQGIQLDYESIKAQINERYKDPQQPKGRAYSEDAGLRMLDQLRQQQQVLLSQYDTSDKIGTQQQALIRWEQQLADIKGKQTLTAEQKSLLANSDLITAQLQQNAALEKQIETREKLLALDKARADIERTITNRQNQYATDELFAGGGLSQYEQQQYTQRLSLEQSYNDKITQLRQQRASATSDVAREEIDQEIQLQQQALQTELSNYDAHIQRMNEARGSFTAGASRAWQEYQDSAANVSAMSQQLFTDAFGGMEDALVNFVVTGKASFKDFATSVISDLARIAARQALVGLGSSIFGSLFSSGVSAATSAVSGSAGGLGLSTDFHAYAKGGVPGGQTISAFRNGVYDSPQYFAFAKGAGVFGEAGPEAIMPLARSSDGSLGVRMISGGGSSSINVNAPVTIVQQSDGSSGDVSNTNTAAAGKQLEAIVQTTLTERLRKEIAPGGLLYRPARG
ncbi:MAG: phage tail tape measure protein [Mixta calida]|uniref:phage tail tape measure protein n=1 Tax=Mixta calida TaxID=665913 RepID=UPI0029152330|nr:phage tail tape measure protein [Mixta calida]MDU4943820.1 phage tail tape measure protein [Mixta calida]